MFFQDCHATVVRHSHDIGTSVPKILHCKFAKFLQRQVCDTARTSRNSLANYFGKKFCIKFLNMVKTLATSSRRVATNENSHDTRETLTFVRKSAPKFAKQVREMCMPVRY